ncbi:HK97-gp10 family putative phage morphogenesis protein [Pseudomonas abietaniphila]
MAEFRLLGVDGVVSKMRGLAPKLQRSGLKKAARRAMNIVRDSAKAKAKSLDDPETAEKIWKNIVTQDSPKEGTHVGGVVMRVGVRGGAGSNQHSKSASGNPGGDTRHWRYIEFGTEHNPAAPFMRPALSENIGPVTDRFATELNSEIDAALRGP